MKTRDLTMGAAALLALAVLQPALLAGDVITVSKGGQSDYTHLAPAVAAAADGDVILIDPGDYWGGAGSVSIDKAIDLIVTGPGNVRGHDIVVENIGPGRTVRIVGLSMDYWDDLVVRDCLGHVRLERLGLTQGWSDQMDLEVRSCNDVSLLDCVIEGEPGEFGGCAFGDGCPGEPGLLAVDAVITAYRTSFTGGRGGDGYWQLLGDTANGGDGGPGASLENSDLMAHECTFVGGEGGYGDPFLGGWDGQDGPPYQGDPPTFGTTPSNQLIGPDTVTEGARYNLRVEGTPGETAVLLVSSGSQYRNLGPFVGQLLVSAPFDQLLPLGTIPPSGLLTVTLDAPFLGPGEEALSRHWQTILVGKGFRYLSNPKAVVVLDGGP